MSGLRKELQARGYGRCYECGEPLSAVCMDCNADLAETVRLRAEVERLKEALAFYANPAIYEPHPHGPAFDRRDLSSRARAALQESSHVDK